jgi:hypothetical protein
VVGKLGVPTATKPLPVLLKVLQHDVLRSLVSLNGINGVVFEALSRLPVARRLESLGVELRMSSREAFEAALARFTALRVLGVNQVGGPADVWETVDLERFELVELSGAQLDVALRLSERTTCVHLRANLQVSQPRVPDLLLTREGTQRRAWINLGMTSVPRADVLQFLRLVDWSAWSQVTVYAKQTFGSEAHQLEALAQRWPARLTVTSSAAQAPKVPRILRERDFGWRRPSRGAALAMSPESEVKVAP